VRRFLVQLASDVRVSNRNNSQPADRNNNIGFPKLVKYCAGDGETGGQQRAPGARTRAFTERFGSANSSSGPWSRRGLPSRQTCSAASLSGSVKRTSAKPKNSLRPSRADFTPRGDSDPPSSLPFSYYRLSRQNRPGRVGPPWQPSPEKRKPKTPNGIPRHNGTRYSCSGPSARSSYGTTRARPGNC